MTGRATPSGVSKEATLIVKLFLAHKMASLAGAAVVASATTAAAATGAIPIVDLSPPEGIVVVVDESGSEGTVSEDTISENTIPDETVPEGAASDDTVPDGELLLDQPGVPILSDGNAYGEVGCEGTHGAYVSSVAHDDDIVGPRGHIVSEAARSSCGKPEDESEESDADEEDESVEDDESVDEDEDEDATDSDDATRGSKPIRGTGNGRGNGHGR